MKVELVNLKKHFGDVISVDNLNLKIEDGEFIAFLGPSGCGKTTTLLMNTGIYKPTGGDIFFNGNRVNELTPKDRDIGMVFQSYALYPHMNVYQNIVFSLTLKKTPKDIMKKEAQKVAEILGIENLLNRKPGQLSGGQQQRVALGRALIKKPGLLLFDEPLSNLDARLRITMRAEIKKLQHDMGITSIYVTHDQVEAMTMADRIAVMNKGVLEAFTEPVNLHDKPETIFIAEFVGNPPMNIIKAELRTENGKLSAVINSGDSISIHDTRKPKTSGNKIKMGIRPQNIHYTKEEGIRSTIIIVEPMGRDNLVLCKIGNLEMSFLEDPSVKLKPGDKVNLKIDSEKLQFFDIETGKSLLWT